jgi:hypothetical protein
MRMGLTIGSTRKREREGDEKEAARRWLGAYYL